MNETATRKPRPLVLRLVVPAVLLLAVSALGGATSGAAGNAVLGILAGLAMAVLALGVYLLSVRRLDRRPADELARRGAAGGLGRGLAVGFAIAGPTVGVIALFGGYQVHGFGSLNGAIGLFGLYVGVATTEELLFRGVLFRILEELVGTWGTLVVTAVVFGALHLVNPGASVVGAVAIAIEGGILLGASWVATRTLWVPIGLHLAWNTTLGAIFSTTVSGTGAPQGLLDATVTGPDVLTGGTVGPEASPVAILITAVPAVLFLRHTRRTGRILPRKARR